ncbi:MAG: methyltransferase [Bacteroidota bacterium]
MSTKPFQFKEFTINQDKTAMKVGTDGVLLGAWVELKDEINSILDIGTGTGLIALQLAQKSDCEIIDALEIEPNAFEQAVENFENSDWGDRLFCYHASLDEFKNAVDEPYDLIISNPPFYNDTFKELEQKRALARHTKTLSFKKLLSATAKLLSKTGTCAYIIPFEEEVNFVKIAKTFNLFPYRITRVKGNQKSPIKRSLLQFSFTKSKVTIDELIIEIERHIYTESYKNMVKDFYIKI